MISSRHVALSCVALSGITIFAIIKNYCSSSKDIVSQLPDDLLVSIVKRISTRDAIRTSVLSKRWRNLHASVPHVNFDCLHMLGLEPENPHHEDSRIKIVNIVNTLLCFFGCEINTLSALQKKFIEGVDTFFRLYSAPKIISCQLACCFTESYPNKLEQWISSLGRLGVEQLTLKFMCGISVNLERRPYFSFQIISEAPSLKFLSLIRCSLQPNLKNQCKNLETLHLAVVIINPAAMECILSNCLNLRSLTMKYCNLHSKLCISGPNLQLKDLTIFRCYDIEKIELYASNLTTLIFVGFDSVKFSFDHVPQLEKFVLRFRGKDILRMLYGELARALHWMKPLIFQTSEENYREMHIPTGINMFSNLKRLDLGFYMLKSDQFSAVPVLECCPLLQELNFVVTHSALHKSIDEAEECDEQQVKVRSLKFHTHLKKVRFSGFTVKTGEINFVSYILRSAIALEQMRINLNYECDRRGMRELYDITWDEDDLRRMCQMFRVHAISKSAKISISRRW